MIINFWVFGSLALPVVSPAPLTQLPKFPASWSFLVCQFPERWELISALITWCKDRRNLRHSISIFQGSVGYLRNCSWFSQDFRIFFYVSFILFFPSDLASFSLPLLLFLQKKNFVLNSWPVYGSLDLAMGILKHLKLLLPNSKQGGICFRVCSWCLPVTIVQLPIPHSDEGKPIRFTSSSHILPWRYSVYVCVIRDRERRRIWNKENSFC